MGRGRNHRLNFLSEHKFCCFCGGQNNSTTIDHVPSRAMFRGRSSPVGYEFPACQPCNSVSAGNEQVVALLARSGNDHPTEFENSEYINLLQGIQNNCPAILSEIQPTANQVKGFLRDRKIRLPPGLLTRDFPLISVNGPLVQDAIKVFARKLFLALHYLHTKKIVPQSGGLSIKWVTNAAPNDPQLLANLDALRRRLPNAPVLRRSNTGLEDQFSYRYFTNDIDTFSAYLAFFGRSFAIVANVRTVEDDFPDVMKQSGILKPFHHDLH